MEWEDGNEYPVIRLDVSSDSHPFYTGRQNSQQRMVVWNVSTKVWTQIKQQLILISTVYFPFGYCRQFLL